MRLIELKTIEDLAYLAFSSPFSVTIQHFEDKEGNHIYFILGGTREETYIFYVKNGKIEGRFINLDTSKSEVKFSDKPIIDPKYKVTPIIEIKRHDLPIK